MKLSEEVNRGSEAHCRLRRVIGRRPRWADTTRYKKIRERLQYDTKKRNESLVPYRDSFLRTSTFPNDSTRLLVVCRFGLGGFIFRGTSEGKMLVLPGVRRDPWKKPNNRSY